MKRLKGKVLVVEDEKSMREVLKMLLESEGHEVKAALDGVEGMAALESDIFDLVITDMKMPNAGGFEVLKKVKEISPDTVVILVTAFSTKETAIEAMNLGAYDYIGKPFNIDEIRLIIRRAIEKKRLRDEVSVLRTKAGSAEALEHIIGRSGKMQELFRLIPRIANNNSNVLITGESGSGKELVATALHSLSPRKEKNFVAINCAAFPEGLLESELFGHMKGSFTGAIHNKQGLFEIADGGSLLLDEVAEMPISLQAKLLRILENGTFRRIGGTSDVKVDVRVISATNKDLQEEILKNKFREDLYYRLNVIPVRIPPLRERKEDIPMLVEHFLRKISTQPKNISGGAMKLLIEYHWKGNVRELENVIERTALLTDRHDIAPSDLPAEISSFKSDLNMMPELTEEGIDIDRIIEDLEKKYLMHALEKSGGVKTEAAKLLRLSFRSFRHRLHKYGIGGEKTEHEEDTVK
jgi:two-component system, NtrC family, response regulator PilR